MNLVSIKARWLYFCQLPLQSLGLFFLSGHSLALQLAEDQSTENWGLWWQLPHVPRLLLRWRMLLQLVPVRERRYCSKVGKCLDALSSCHTVAFDKSGTLTTGGLMFKAIEPIYGHLIGNKKTNFTLFALDSGD